MLRALVLLTFIFSTAAAQCCTGTGPSIPPNTVAGCQSSSTTSAVPAVWTLQPATTACACFPYKCTSQGPTVYGQQCVNQFGFQAFIQATQAVMGPMYTCVANGAQGLSPSWILIAAVLLLAANA